MAGTMSTMTAAQAALRDGSHEQARAGFEVVAPTKSKASSGTPRVVMRRKP